MHWGRGRPLSRVSDQAWLRAFRSDAATEQLGLCLYCTVPLTAETLTGDHLVPRSRGGQTTRENIGASCEGCNRAKGDLPAGQFHNLIRRMPAPGSPLRLWMAWSRRRIWVRTHRACRHIDRAVHCIA